MKNVRAIRGLALTSLASLGLIAVTPAFADSEISTGANAEASASVDFRVIIPQFIRFQVGNATAGNVDVVEFDVANPNSGAPVGRTNGGALAVELLGNVGDIQIEADTNTTDLEDGSLPTAQTISWGEIDTVSSNANLGAPDLGTSSPVTVTPTAGRIVNRSTTWSYEYANSALVGAGTYEGTVTYTASAP